MQKAISPLILYQDFLFCLSDLFVCLYTNTTLTQSLFLGSFLQIDLQIPSDPVTIPGGSALEGIGS